MSESRQRKHASHLPVLEIIFKNSNIRDVFEYGCGIHSTNFFVNHAKTVTSIEMNRKIWYDKIKSEIISDKLNLLFILGGLDSIKYFNSMNKNYDMVFVDGDNFSRKDCAYNSFGKAETIVVHDVDLTWRRWKRRGWFIDDVPEPYKTIVMQIESPSTTIYTKNHSLFEELKKHNSVVIEKEI